MTSDSRATRRRPKLLTPWLRRLLMLAIAAVIVWAVWSFLGRIDWPQVGQALGKLSWWQPLVLVALLIVRQLFSAAPLAFFIPGVSLYRATVNDLGAMTMAAFAPAPADMVLRVAMFTSWGFPSSRAMAGTVMNALSLFIVRFATPALGFVLVVITGGELGVRLLDIASLLVAAVLVAGTLLVVRTEGWALWVGRTLGELARLVRTSVDPDRWSASCAGFRGDVVDRFGYGFPRGLLAVCGMVATDVAILTLALRFVGVGASTLPFVAVAIAFLFAYPLTCMPMQGLGALDVLALAGLAAAGGGAVQEPAFAALIIWRVFTVAGPLLLGVGAVGLWRHQLRVARRAEAADPAPPTVG